MSEDYWDSVVKPALELKFVDALTGVESTASYALKSSISDFESDSMDGRMLVRAGHSRCTHGGRAIVGVTRTS